MIPPIYPYQYDSLITTTPTNLEENWDNLSNWDILSIGGSQVTTLNNSLNITWESSVTPLWDDVTTNAIYVLYNNTVTDSFYIESGINSNNSTMGLTVSTQDPFDPSFAFRLYYDGFKIICDGKLGGLFTTYATKTIRAISLRIRKSLNAFYFEYWDGSTWELLYRYVYIAFIPYVVGFFAMETIWNTFTGGNVNASETKIGVWERGSVGSVLEDWYYNPKTAILECPYTTFSYPRGLIFGGSIDRTTAVSINITNYKGSLFTCFNESLGNGYYLETDSVTQTGTLYNYSSWSLSAIISFTLPLDSKEYELGLGFENNYIIGWVKGEEINQLFMILDTTYSSGNMALGHIYEASYSNIYNVLVHDVKATPNLLFRHTSCKRENNTDFIAEATYDMYQQFISELDQLENNLSYDLPSIVSEDNLPYVNFCNGEYYVPGNWDFEGIIQLQDIFKDKWEDELEKKWLLVWKHTQDVETTSCYHTIKISTSEYITVGGNRPPAVTELLFWWIQDSPSPAIYNILESWDVYEEEIDNIFSLTSDEELNLTVFKFEELEDLVLEASQLSLLPKSFSPNSTNNDTLTYIQTLDIQEQGDIYNWELIKLDDVLEISDELDPVLALIQTCYTNTKRSWKLLSQPITAYWKQLLILTQNIKTLTSITESNKTKITDLVNNMDSMLPNFEETIKSFNNINCINTKVLTKLKDELPTIEDPFSSIEIPDSLITNIQNCLDITEMLSTTLDTSFQTIQFESEHIKDILNDITVIQSCEEQANKLVNSNLALISNLEETDLNEEVSFFQNIENSYNKE